MCSILDLHTLLKQNCYKHVYLSQTVGVSVYSPKPYCVCVRVCACACACVRVRVCVRVCGNY